MPVPDSALKNLTGNVTPISVKERKSRIAKAQQLMHKANEITLTAYAHVCSKLELGMSQSEVKSLMSSAQSALGGVDIWNMALFNEASAYPHGTKNKQFAKVQSF